MFMKLIYSNLEICYAMLFANTSKAVHFSVYVNVKFCENLKVRNFIHFFSRRIFCE